MANDTKFEECKYCGKKVSLSGLKNHEKACAKKQEEEVKIEPEAQVDTTETVEVAINPKPKKDLVKVKLSEAINCYIGGVRYTLAKGEEAEVPSNVKEVLKTAGYLQAI